MATAAETKAVQAFLSKMREGLGASGTPNVATKWYASRNGNMYLNAAWCNMRVTWAAFHSGNHDAACFGKDFAYTVYHAQAFRERGRWTYGTSGIRAGDVIFFDWDGGQSIGAIDHVGVVEKVLSNGVQTIEGNTGGALRRKLRRAFITGYGRPDWDKSEETNPLRILSPDHRFAAQRLLYHRRLMDAEAKTGKGPKYRKQQQYAERWKARVQAAMRALRRDAKAPGKGGWDKDNRGEKYQVLKKVLERKIK